MEEQAENKGSLAWLIINSLVHCGTHKGLDIWATGRVEVGRELCISKARKEGNDEKGSKNIRTRTWGSHFLNIDQLIISTKKGLINWKSLNFG